MKVIRPEKTWQSEKDIVDYLYGLDAGEGCAFKDTEGGLVYVIYSEKYGGDSFVVVDADMDSPFMVYEAVMLKVDKLIEFHGLVEHVGEIESVKFDLVQEVE